MKICPTPFTNKQKKNALQRISRALILGKIKWAESRKFYLAMLHLARYLDRLNLI
jgi:hypothetical protein